MNNLHLESLKKVYLKVHRNDAGNGGKAFKSDWFIYTFRLEPEWDAPELFRESFGDEWKLASERISIQPRAPSSGLERVKQSGARVSIVNRFTFAGTGIATNNPHVLNG